MLTERPVLGMLRYRRDLDRRGATRKGVFFLWFAKRREIPLKRDS
jgi:hypothetical protein